MPKLWKKIVGDKKSQKKSSTLKSKPRQPQPPPPTPEAAPVADSSAPPPTTTTNPEHNETTNKPKHVEADPVADNEPANEKTVAPLTTSEKAPPKKVAKARSRSGKSVKHRLSTPRGVPAAADENIDGDAIDVSTPNGGIFNQWHLRHFAQFHEITKRSREQKRRARQQLEAAKHRTLTENQSDHQVIVGTKLRQGDLSFRRINTNTNRVTVSTNVQPRSKTGQRKQGQVKSHNKEPSEKHNSPDADRSVEDEAAVDDTEEKPLTIVDALNAYARESIRKAENGDASDAGLDACAWNPWQPIDHLRLRRHFNDAIVESNTGKTEVTILQQEAAATPKRSKWEKRVRLDEMQMAREYNVKSGRYKDYKEEVNWAAVLKIKK